MLSTFLTNTATILDRGWRSFVPFVRASIFGGGGLQNINAPAGMPNGDLTGLFKNIINTVLNLVSLVAVAVVIYAGILLIVSLGDDAKKDTAKKALLYMVIGLVVILLARVIVSFVINFATTST